MWNLNILHPGVPLQLSGSHIYALEHILPILLHKQQYPVQSFSEHPLPTINSPVTGALILIHGKLTEIFH